MNKAGSKLLALGASVVLHALVVGILLLLTIKSSPTPAPKTKEITLVSVGTYGMGQLAGGGEQTRYEPSPHPQKVEENIPQTPPTSKPNNEPLLASNNNNPSLENARKKKEKEEAIKQQELQKQREREQQKQKEIDSRISGAFGKGTANSPKNNAGQGTGASSTIGAGFSLSGRSIEGSGGVPVRPEGFPPTRGRVTIRIVVNSSGTVVDATALLKGTNITNQRTIQAAIRAARQTKFNPVPSGPNQQGSIVYNFDIQ